MLFETCLLTNGGQLIQSAITAAAGLLGVLVGARFTSTEQNKERQNARVHEHLMGFYAPLRGIRAEIKAKSELRGQLHAAAQAAWSEKFKGIDDPLMK
jgi:hypothetical protein